MASQSDELLLHVRALSEGQQDLLTLANSFTTVLQKAEGVQSQQAATSLRQEQALNSMVPKLGAAATGVQNLSRETAALAPRVALFNQLFERGFQILGQFIEQAVGVRGILQQGFDTERSTAQFTILFGSATKAREEMQFLSDFVHKTDFTMPDAVAAAKQLENLNFSTRKYLGSLGELASVMDVPLTQAVAALQTAGRGQLRSIQRLVPDLQLILHDIGVKSIAEVQQSTEKQGQFLEAVLNKIQSRTVGATALLHATVSGGIKQIEQTLFDLREKIFNSGIGEAVSNIINRIIAKIDELEKNGSIDRFAKRVSDALTVILDALTVILDAGEKLATFGAAHPQVVGAAFGLGAALAGTLALSGPLLNAIELGKKLWIVLLANPEIALWAGIVVGAGLAAAAVHQVTTALQDLGKVQEEQAAREAEKLGGAAVGTKIPVFATGKTRGGAQEFTTKVPTLPEEQVTAPRETDDEHKRRVLVDEAAAQKAFDKEKALAVERVRLASETEDAITKAVQDSIAERIALLGYTGTRRIQAAEQIAREELDQIRAHGALRVKLEADIEAKAGEARARVREAGGPAAVQSALLKEIALREDNQKRILAMELENGTAETVARRKIDDDLRAVRKAAIEQDRSERVNAFLDDVRFERQIQGQTGSQYAAYLEQRLNMLRENLRVARAIHSAEAGNLQAIIAAGEKEQTEALNKSLIEKRQLSAKEAGIERDAFGSTTTRYLDELARRRAATKEGTAAYIGLTQRMTDATELLNQEIGKTATAAERLKALGISDETAKRAAGSGVTEDDILKRMGHEPAAQPDQIANEAITSQAIKDMNEHFASTPDILARAQDQFAAFFIQLAGLSGKTWAEMTEDQRKTFEQMVSISRIGFAAAAGFARGFQTAVGNEFKKLLTTGATSQGVLTAIVKASFKEMAASALEEMAKEAAAKASLNAIEAIEALAKGDFKGAALHGRAALKFGLFAGVETGAAAAIRSESAPTPEQAGAASADQATKASGDQKVKITASDRNITMNFYLSVTYQGGLNLFGPDAPRALVNEMIPALQEAIDNKQLHL